MSNHLIVNPAPSALHGKKAICYGGILSGDRIYSLAHIMNPRLQTLKRTREGIIEFSLNRRCVRLAEVPPPKGS